MDASDKSDDNILPDIYLRTAKSDIDSPDNGNVWKSDESLTAESLSSNKSSKHADAKMYSSKNFNLASKGKLQRQLNTNHDSTKSESLPSSNQSEADNDNFLPNFIVGGAISTSLSSLQHITSDNIDLTGFRTAIEVPMAEEPLAHKSLENRTTPSLASVSSFASSRILEWDSGADVGYLKKGANNPDEYLSALEKMAIRNYALSLISELHNQNIDAALMQGGTPGSLLKLTYDHSDPGLDSSQTHSFNVELSEKPKDLVQLEPIAPPEKLSEAGSSQFLENQSCPFLSTEYSAANISESITDAYEGTNSSSSNLEIGFKSGSPNTVSELSQFGLSSTQGSTSTLLSTFNSSYTDSVTVSPSLSTLCSSNDGHSQIKGTSRQGINATPSSGVSPKPQIQETDEVLSSTNLPTTLKTPRLITPNENSLQTMTYSFAIVEDSKGENESFAADKPEERTDSTKSPSTKSISASSVNDNIVDAASSFEFYSSLSRNKRTVNNADSLSSKRDVESLQSSGKCQSIKDVQSFEDEGSLLMSSHNASRYSASASSVFASDYSIVYERTNKLKRRAKKKEKILEELESSGSISRIPSRHLKKYIKALEKLEKNLAPFIDDSYSSISDVDPYYRNATRKRHNTYTKESPDQRTPSTAISESSSTFVGESPNIPTDKYITKHILFGEETPPSLQTPPPPQQTLPPPSQHSASPSPKLDPYDESRSYVSENRTADSPSVPIFSVTSDDTSRETKKSVLEKRTVYDRHISVDKTSSTMDEITNKLKYASISSDSNLSNQKDFWKSKDKTESIGHQNFQLPHHDFYKSKGNFDLYPARMNPLCTSSEKDLAKMSKNFGQMFPSCQNLSGVAKMMVDAETQTDVISSVETNIADKYSSISKPLSTSSVHPSEAKTEEIFLSKATQKSPEEVSTSGNEIFCTPKTKYLPPKRVVHHSSDSSEKRVYNIYKQALPNVSPRNLPSARYASSESSLSSERSRPASCRKPASGGKRNVFTLANGRRCAVSVGLHKKSHGWGSISSSSAEKENLTKKSQKSTSSDVDALPPPPPPTIGGTQIRKDPLMPQAQNISPTLGKRQAEAKKGVKFTVNLYNAKQDTNSIKPKSLSEELLQMNKKKEIFALNEALSLAKPEFISLAERRRAAICTKQRHRRQCQELNHEALAVIPDNLRTPSVLQKFLIKSNGTPLFSYKSMRIQNKRLFGLLPESGIPASGKLRDGTQKTNRLMAQLYSQKLRQKALKGKVSHRHREVISPLR